MEKLPNDTFQFYVPNVIEKYIYCCIVSVFFKWSKYNKIGAIISLHSKEKPPYTYVCVFFDKYETVSSVVQTCVSISIRS